MKKTAVSPLLSIVICTLNRASLLRMAVESVLAQEYSPDCYELIVVDNGSTDDTREVVDRLSAGRMNVHYFFEEKQGLSNARNLGWKEARGEYVGFLDDDAKVPPKWLWLANEICQIISPAGFGGPCYAFYLSSKPAWYKNEYGSWVQGTQARYIGEKEYLVGGNMFIRRTLLESMGGFDPSFGMKGNLIGYGEETALIEKIRHQQEDNCLYYDPRLCIEHLVRSEKMKWGWIIRQRIADGRDYYNLFPGRKVSVSAFRLIYRIIKNVLLLIFDLILRVFNRDREKFPHFQNYYYEHTTLYIAALGQLLEQVKEKVPYARR
jgi:glycosyltransferase involved in cell wall biosynthesis